MKQSLTLKPLSTPAAIAADYGDFGLFLTQRQYTVLCPILCPSFLSALSMDEPTTNLPAGRFEIRCRRQTYSFFVKPRAGLADKRALFPLVCASPIACMWIGLTRTSGRSCGGTGREGGQPIRQGHPRRQVDEPSRSLLSAVQRWERLRVRPPVGACR
jgi:hypothetical protein